MKIHHDLIQGSQEWKNARTGVITASEIGPFVLGTDKRARSARFNYLCGKLGEIDDEIEEIFPTADMKRGTALEPIARIVYQEATGYDVEQVGFVTHDTLPLGCSPDGLIVGPDGKYLHGVEIKGPKPSTQVRRLLEKKCPDDYWYQIHMSMWLMDLDRWDFYSFSPKVTLWQKDRDSWTVREWEYGPRPPFLISVHRERFTDELGAALQDLCTEYESMKRDMASIFEQYRKEAAHV